MDFHDEESGYSEKDMPKNRLELFVRVLWDHLFDLVKVNAMLLLFWLPFLIWTGLNIAALQSAAAAVLEEGGEANLLGELSGQLFVWLLGLIPCIAITGPSSAGAAYVMRNWARDEHAFLFLDFVDAFKSNFKQALGISSITSLMPVCVFAAFLYYGQLAKRSRLMIVPLAIVLVVVVIWTLMLPLLYPMMIGYKLRFTQLLQNAFLMALARLPQMVATRLVTALPVLLLLRGIASASPVALLIVSLYYMVIGFSFSRLLYASVANAVFDRYLNPNIEGAPVRMGLRPLHEDDEDEGDDEDDPY